MTKKIQCILWTSLIAAGCASAPETRREGRNLEATAAATVDTMVTRDPALAQVLARAEGYIVFPEIAKGGLLVGGAHGVGVVYQRGREVGYAELNQASIGAQIGGQSFSEIVVFTTPEALSRAMSGNFDVGGDVSAIMVNKGAAAGVRFEDGVAVFVLPKGGLMVELSVHGQSIEYGDIPRG